ncbi:MAG: cytochrome c oxidase subunit I [Chromatiales bacterium]|jgi:cytochrome c oxidase subunit 1|nr:cytochrome c oxidase subunit I [Chromatiales bacterium]MDX9767263.1 cytochrome c oxidase subunit I [Ectothiorhodospiraceae bacterium]
MSTAETHAHEGHHHDQPTGLARWLFTTNHKEIGTMYLIFAFAMLFIGGGMILLVRAELFQPGLQIMQPEFYNQLITLHGLIMVFGVAMPAATGLANWMLPMMLGAPDMALPRLNNWGFWILPPAATLLVTPFFLGLAGIGTGAVDAGWTMYAPLSVQTGWGMDFAIFAVHMLGMSSILAAINVIVTIVNMRAPGMTMMKMPLFAWGFLMTAILLILIMPVLAGGVTMILTDRHFGTHFFDAAGGGDPVLWQHIFWFMGHPEVYVLLLPIAGAIPHVLQAFSRKPTYGYKAQVYGMWAITVLSVVVWAHHMFTSGMPTTAQLYFMYSTMLISLPLAVLFFCWIATVWKGSLSFETPMLFALGFIILFGWGGLTGLVLADAAADPQYHNAYFLVAHFHYALYPTTILGVMAAVYYWLPKWTGHMYDEKLGKLHFWLAIIGFNMTFIPQFFVGLAGMPRRIPDYALQFAEWNMLSSIGAFILGASHLVFLYVVIKCVRGGAKAEAKSWEGADGLEWTVPSPAPLHTFDTQPVVK